MNRTVVFFHAHPDDEAIATSGTMMHLVDSGDRVVAVFATRGELGEVADGVLRDGEALAERRQAEAAAAAAIIGVHRLEWLGYHDSGMRGAAANGRGGAFASVPVDEGAEKLARVLAEEHADALVVYDDHGGYGHPDHVQVHRVGVEAARRAGVALVYEVTMNRDRVKAQIAAAREAFPEFGEEMPEVREDGPERFGSPDSIITTRIDVHRYIERKRDAMRAHASQIAETSFFLTMAPDVFSESFGTEWYIRRGARPDTRETEFFQ